MQVVTNENLTQLIQTGKVDEFVAPAAPVAEVKAETAKGEPERNEDGTFKTVDKADEKADKGTTEAADAATEKKPDDQAGKIEADDKSDEDLPERVRKKIGEKHRAMREAEEFGEREFNRRKAAEKRAVELEEELSQLKSKSGPAQEKTEAVDAKAPKPEDFKTVAEYADALVEYKLDKREAERREQASRTEADSARSKQEREFRKQEAEVIAVNPDYRDTVKVLQDEEIPTHIAQYLFETGPKLIYPFAKLPAEERNRIRGLSPIRAIAELGKLEAKLEKPAQAKSVEQPAVSRAPSPITPLSGDGAVPVNKDPATMSLQELREYERIKSAEQRSRR